MPTRTVWETCYFHPQNPFQKRTSAQIFQKTINTKTSPLVAKSTLPNSNNHLKSNTPHRITLKCKKDPSFSFLPTGILHNTRRGPLSYYAFPASRSQPSKKPQKKKNPLKLRLIDGVSEARLQNNDAPNSFIQYTNLKP